MWVEGLLRLRVWRLGLGLQVSGSGLRVFTWLELEWSRWLSLKTLGSLLNESFDLTGGRTLVVWTPKQGIHNDRACKYGDYSRMHVRESHIVLLQLRFGILMMTCIIVRSQ